MSSEDVPVLEPYNPLDKIRIGQSIASALTESDLQSFPLQPFIGAGVYAIYYCGDFPQYSELSKMNTKHVFYPIYVGKAAPAGARKGGIISTCTNGMSLFSRLNQHAQSLQKAENLDINHFSCRFLAVDDIWIPLAESVLIERYKPLWNHCLDGFGNHDPGKGRYNQKMSPWDLLHPGREWARKLKPCAYSMEQILERIHNHFVKQK